MMNAEEVKVGCFQVVLVLLLGINYVIVAMSHALPVFYNYTPKFYCQTKNSMNKSYGCYGAVNSSIDVNRTYALPEAPVFASCSGEYRFMTNFAENSVVTEWGLVCEKRYLSLLGPTVYYVGVLLGAWVLGFLSDRIGRLPILAICLYAQGTMAVALYIVQSYPVFLALRGLQGICIQGLQNSTYILSLELFPARFRTFVALIMQIFWSVGLILLAALSYAIPDWRILQLAISVPTATTVLYVWIIPESPRWLLAMGKLTEADMAFERIAKYNGCCTRLRTENVAIHEECVKSNIRPIKPERKSRVTSLDLKKARTEEDQRVATNLLNESEPAGQNVTKTAAEANSMNPENEFSNVPLRRKTQSYIADYDKNLPSSSNCDHRSKTVSQSGYDQRISVKAAEEVVLRRTKKERTNKNEEKNNKKRKEALIQIDSVFKNTPESSTLKKYGSTMICQWLTSAMAYSILDDLAPIFPINRHIMFALGGKLELSAYIVMYFVLSRYGRRLPMCIYQSFNGIICILIAAFLILTTTAPWIDFAKTIILLFGRATVVSTISIIYLYTTETFPTVVRGSCLGLCVVFAKIGNLSMPHLLLSVQHIPLPILLLVVGMLCLISSALALILPETLSQILPDQVADVKNVIDDSNHKGDDINIKNDMRGNDTKTQRQVLREKLFSEDWVDAGNGILVNFMENKSTE